MKKNIKIITSILAILLLIFAGGMLYLTRGLKDKENIQMDGINISNISDGTYEGKFEAGRWTNQLRVTVKGQRITNIEIIDDVTFAMPDVRDELFSNVIASQNTDVDAVTEATITSK